MVEALIAEQYPQLKDIVFWSRWASMAVTSLVGYFLVILHKDEKNRMLPWYQNCMEEIARKASQIGESFDEFLHELNLRRRVEWYKRAVNEKIAELNKKLLEADLRGKPTSAIAQKIEKYKAIISDEFIAANKNALKTRSKTISSVQVLSEAKSGDNGETNFRSASGFYLGKGTAKVVMSLIMTAAFACVVVQNFGAGISVASVVMTILSVLSTLISVSSAVVSAAVVSAAVVSSAFPEHPASMPAAIMAAITIAKCFFIFCPLLSSPRTFRRAPPENSQTVVQASQDKSHTKIQEEHCSHKENPDPGKMYGL